MSMRWLRRDIDLTHATVRLSTRDDITSVSRLFRDGARRYYGLMADELPTLLAHAHGSILEYGNEIQGAAITGSFINHAVWLRGVVLARGIPISAGLESLLTPLHESIYDRGMYHIFYAGDEASDIWLIPALRRYGYVQDTSVIVYEKRFLHIPSFGNADVAIRPALPSDLRTIITLDRACFEVQWMKDDTTLGQAITEGTFFVVGELGGRTVGYAYATSHFGGRLLHLVRIAVDPRKQGRGIGVRLLAEVIRFAQEQQAHIVTLNTQAYNTRAQRLYQWFGFTDSGERQPVMRYDLGL